MKNKFYLIATFARSFDNHHLKNDINHLISSIFYTEKFNIENVKNSSLKLENKLYLINIGSFDINEYNTIDHFNNIIEIRIPFIYLINHFIINNIFFRFFFNKNFRLLIYFL